MEKPSKTFPLVYNLFGCKDQDDSLVLDYNDMFKMLKSALQDPSLPDKLMASVKKARTYIFLGFQFDKWYSQLLLKILCDNEESDKRISVNSPLIDDALNIFVINQFQIKFISNHNDFLGELHERCEKAKILRGVEEENICPAAAEILRYIKNGNLEEALSKLSSASNGKDWKDDVILLQGRYAVLQQQREDMDSRDYRPELVKIINSLIEYCKKVCL